MRQLLYIIGFILSLACQAQVLSLRQDSPSRYVVKPGDTLWDISSRYLAHPWEWNLLWQANPSIKNPHHLYPGAVIELHHDHDRPYLRVLSNGTVKLSPSMQPIPQASAIPPIPLSEMEPFLDSSLVLDRDALINAPYVIAFRDEHLLVGQGDEVYVKNLCPRCNLAPGVSLSYGIYRPDGEYFNPFTKAFLGYKAKLVGYAELLRQGDPMTVVITDLTQGGIQLMDRVMPNTHKGFDVDFMPRAPSNLIRGLIIDALGDYRQGAEGLVVVLDRGTDYHLQAGDVLAVYTPAKRMKELECPYGCVRIPRERVGEVMVFRTFTHTSFALVVRATRPIKIMDRVANP
jgi:hypothetical protein